ncbi:MAG: rod shape-determining protein RodA [Actinobacteria bacterium]|nr:rod shape-determining protein RodA [Actinomycetota bacterium]
MDLLSSINRRVDLMMVIVALLLCAYGVIMVFSATQSLHLSSGDPYLHLKKQVVSLFIGVIAIVIISISNYNRWKNHLISIYLLNISILALVLLIGKTVNGAKSWIELGTFFQFQPSELSKLLLIVTLASFFASRKTQLNSIQDLVLALVHVSLPLLLVLAQPDLGTGLCFIAILLGMMLIAGFPARHFAIIFLIGIIIGFSAFHFQLLEPHQVERLTVFINPNNAPRDAIYNLVQSKIAIGSGQFSGKGLFSGTQAKLQFLPERHTDFIFSVVGEELGFLGASFLLLLFFILIMRGLRTAAYAKNLFGTLLVAGIVSLWIFQIMINVGMTIGLMPITGIPLPFISYGNSSLITHLAAIGILLSVYARRFV